MNFILRSFHCIIILVVTFCEAHAAAHSLTLVSYYPAPTGNYDQLSANNIGIGTFDPHANLDVYGNVHVKGGIVATSGDYHDLAAANMNVTQDMHIKGSVIASQFKTSNRSSLMTIILFDQTGVKRSCPSGYAQIGQWVTSNGQGEFQTSDSFGNIIPGGSSGVMGLCSSI